MANNIHFANYTNDTDYNIMVFPNPDWVVADLAAGLSSLLITASAAVNAINTARDLYASIKIVQALAQTTALAMKFTEFFVEKGATIRHGEYKNILEKTTYENPLNYLSPSLYGALLGASDVSIIVTTPGLYVSAMFNSNSDYSWIGYGDNEGVVRAKYGKIWEPDPEAGYIPWESKAK